MRLVEQLHQPDHRNDFRTRYIKYRAGRLKHQYWLWNRKRTHKVIDQYDALILKNCQQGRTAFFASSGYYLKDIWPQIDVIEMHSVVKEFYSDIFLAQSRDQLADIVPHLYQNFAVVNNRSDHLTDMAGVTGHVKNYVKLLAPGARFFYSFRDTQIHYNRLRINSEKYFLEWALSLSELGLNLSWHSIEFPKKVKDTAGNFNQFENPDTVNGNLKFWFSYREKPWQIQQ